MRSLLVGLVLAAACGSGGDSDCDGAQLAVSCTNPNGQCVDFTGLSTADQSSAGAGCTRRGGTPLGGSCPTASRLGTCTIPPTGANTDVTCSPHAQIQIRYFDPYTAASAQATCTGGYGAVRAPG